jgi:hypothetical protein
MAVIANAKARVILLNIVILLVLKPRADLRGLDREARDLFPSLHSNGVRGSNLRRAACALLKESHRSALSRIPISITLS